MMDYEGWKKFRKEKAKPLLMTSETIRSWSNTAIASTIVLMKFQGVTDENQKVFKILENELERRKSNEA